MFSKISLKPLPLALLAAASLFSIAPQADAAVEYVRVCSAKGAGNAYIPGTDSCVNLNDINANSAQNRQNLDGISIGMALQTPILPAGKDFGISGGWGGFDGGNAVAMGGIYRVKDDFYLTGGLGVGTETGVIGGRAGFMYAW